MTEAVEKPTLEEALRWKGGLIFQDNFKLYNHEEANDHEKGQRDKFINKFVEDRLQEGNKIYFNSVQNSYEANLAGKDKALS